MRTMSMREFRAVSHRRAASDEQHRRGEEVSVARAILRAEPSLTRSDALRQAASIVARRRADQWL